MIILYAFRKKADYEAGVTREGASSKALHGGSQAT
jgi:hypothetical protein